MSGFMVRTTSRIWPRIRSVATDCGLTRAEGGSSKAGTLTVPSGSNFGRGGASWACAPQAASAICAVAANAAPRLQAIGMRPSR